MKASGRHDFFFPPWLKFVQRLLFADEDLVLLRMNTSLWYMNDGRISATASMFIFCAAS